MCHVLVEVQVRHTNVLQNGELIAVFPNPFAAFEFVSGLSGLSVYEIGMVLNASEYNFPRVYSGSNNWIIDDVSVWDNWLLSPANM
jgi:hypothetical protein